MLKVRRNVTLLLLAITMKAAEAQTVACTSAPTDPLAPTCSLSTLNSKCTLFINRSNPAAPANLYLRRGASVTLVISSVSPLEKLSLDTKGGITSPPVDTVGAGLQTLFSQIGSIAISLQSIPTAPATANPTGNAGQAPSLFGFTNRGTKEGETHRLDDVQPPTLYEKIVQKQIELREVLKYRSKTLGEVGTVDSLNQSLSLLHDANVDPLGIRDFDGWRDVVRTGLQEALKQIARVPDNHATVELDEELAAIFAGATNTPTTVDKDHLAVLVGNQTKLDASSATLDAQSNDLKRRLNSILSAVDRLHPAPAEVACVIEDAPHQDRGKVTETRTLNASMTLLDALKPPTSEKMPDDLALRLASIEQQPTKTKVLDLQLTFENPPGVEFTSGVLFPLLPFHSYQAVTNAAGTTSVQKSSTWSVVPAAMVNFRFGQESAIRDTRFTAMFSIGAGYSTATSSAAFAFGPSLAFGSLVISPLAVAAQDTRLAGGFVVGGPLGSASAPQTHTVFSIKPSLGVSVRLPLGGASK